MERTRVLLVGMQRMLREIISDHLSEQPDIEVVAELADEAELPQTVLATRADVVILGAERPGLTAGGLAALYSRPVAKLLAVTGDGREGYLYELRPHKVPLGELSAERLVNSIRSAVAGRL